MGEKFSLSQELLGAVYKNQDDLLAAIQSLLREGADPNYITSHNESALCVASNNGRFDAVRLLLDHGADKTQLKWTNLFFAVVYGDIENLEEVVTGESDIEAKDCWNRTPLLVSILLGDKEKTNLLLEAGADRDAVGRCGKPPLFYAIQNDNLEMLSWLVEKGFDIQQRDSFWQTALMFSVECKARSCFDWLLKCGIDIREEEFNQQQAIDLATDKYFIKALLEFGADPNRLNSESRAMLLGYGFNQPIESTFDEYRQGKLNVFGRTNPQRMKNSFWHAMVRSGATAYAAAQKFEKDRDIYSGSNNRPIWCYERFGKSITFLSDGRCIEIAGEHEDYYDPDFCIYNDVFVHDGQGNFEIYGYPPEVFPPTDFHTATLVGGYIYIIGGLGYPQARQIGHTPVYRLDIKTLAIEKVETRGEMPGWINRHQALFDGENVITVSGGKLIVLQEDQQDYVDNEGEYQLCVKSCVWRKV